MIKIDSEKIEKFLKHLPEFLAKNSFLFFLGLLFINLVIGAIVFYKLDYLVKNQEIEIDTESFIPKQEDLELILEKLDSNADRFNQTDLKNYPNFFR